MKKLLSVIVLLPILLIVGGIAYCEINKAYWDNKVKQWCEEDGGVTVFERVELTKEEYDALPKYDNKYVTVHSKHFKGRLDFFYDDTTTVIKQSNPYVRRVDVLIKRRIDDKVIAKYSTFHRRGGDFPSGISMGSSYACPDAELRQNKVSQIFSIKGELK